jgi:hypothetical protein
VVEEHDRFGRPTAIPRIARFRVARQLLLIDPARLKGQVDVDIEGLLRMPSEALDGPEGAHNPNLKPLRPITSPHVPIRTIGSLRRRTRHQSH